MSLQRSVTALLSAVIREQDLTVAEAAQRLRLPYGQLVALLHGGATMDLSTADELFSRLGVGLTVQRAHLSLPQAQVKPIIN